MNLNSANHTHHHHPPSPWLRSHHGTASEPQIRKLVHFHLHRLVYRMFAPQGQPYCDFMIRMAGDAFIIAGDIDLSASQAEIDSRIRAVRDSVVPVFNEVKRAMTLLTQGYHIQPVVHVIAENMEREVALRKAGDGAKVMAVLRDLGECLGELGEVLGEVSYRTYPEGADWTGVAELFDGTEVLEMYKADLGRFEVIYGGLLGKVARARADGFYDATM